MKWIFVLFLIGFTPALIFWLRNNQGKLPMLMFVFGALPFLEYMMNISVSPYGWPQWRGYAQGLTISLTDAVAIAILFGTKGRMKLRVPLLAKISFAALFVAFLYTWALSEVRIASSFYGWQLLRTLLVFLAVAKAVSISPKAAPALFGGLVAGVVIQSLNTLMQFAGGMRQAGGVFGHQNTLGMITNFIAIPAFALFLGGHYRKLTLVCIVASLLVAYTGGSRATIGLMMGGMAIALLFSIWHHRTSRKMTIGGVGAIAALLLSAVMIQAVDRRTDAERASSNAMRQQMIDGAWMMIKDHPMGIGANMYVTTANTGGYVERSGVTWTSSQALIHNTYYLVMIEFGPLGLLGILGLLASALMTAIRNVRKLRPSLEGEYSAGAAAVLIAFSVHSYYEWIPMIFAIHTMFALTLGLLVGFWSRMGSGRQNAFDGPKLRQSGGPRRPVRTAPRLARR